MHFPAFPFLSFLKNDVSPFPFHIISISMQHSMEAYEFRDRKISFSKLYIKGFFLFYNKIIKYLIFFTYDNLVIIDWSLVASRVK